MVGQLKAGTQIATMQILTAHQAAFLAPIDPRALAVAQSEEEWIDIVKASSEATYKSASGKQISSLEEQPEHWFPTPETCKEPEKLRGIEKRIYTELVELKKKEKLDPSANASSRDEFLRNFNWKGSALSTAERKQVEDLLVEFNDIFARHRMDIGYNDEFKVKLTPEHDKAVYTQSPPTNINMREDMLVELALMQYYGVITPLPFSKYSSPIFAQRKPNGKLRMLIDLRKINHLIRHDYSTNNFPISTLADAGNHLAGKKIFCKLDCTQSYFALQMADELSVQMLAFNFESRNYAFKRMAQGLSRSVSAFSSFMRKYLDACITADKCYQYVDDIGTAANTVAEMISNLRSVFEALRRSGLRLTMAKCEFGLEKIDFLGNTITSQGISPNEKKVDEFSVEADDAQDCQTNKTDDWVLTIL